MNKDLSKILCELAGIEGRKIYYPIHKKYSHPNNFDEIIYPCFKVPENFVKLLECLYVHNYTLLEESLNFTHYTDTFVINVLTEVKYELTNRTHNYKLDKLKQALQATDWVY
jgi:hypothetical protein